ncbi:MAG: YihY/virulence factor BrkB family protein [Bacillota bacterium]
MRIGTLWTLTKHTLYQWNEDRVSRLSASLAFYTAFSIAPILIIAIAIAGFLFTRQAAQREVTDQLEQLMGKPAAQAVEMLLASAATPGAGSGLATVLGILILIYGATNVFAELQDSMNTIWEVKPKPGRFWWQILKDRIFSFVMVLGTAFLLVVSLVISTLLAAGSRHIAGGGEVLWRIINLTSSLAVFTLVFAAIFKWIPDVKIRWADVWIGAVFTSVMFTLGKSLIGLYLGRSSVISVYGAAGSLAILLIWVYYSAQILFIGAEFTQVYARRLGTPIPPDDAAIPITEEERAQQGIPSRHRIDEASRAQDQRKHAGNQR